MEVHVHIPVQGNGFPVQAEMDVRDQVEACVEEYALGEVVDAGSGLGGMDLRIETPHPKRAVAQLREFLRERGLVSATCKAVRPSRARPAPVPYMPGDALAVRLPDGDFGAALVLGRQEDSRNGVSLLVAATRYKSGSLPAVSDVAPRDWLVLSHHSWKGQPHLNWYMARDYPGVAAALQKIGVLPLLPSDPQQSRSIAPWPYLANQIVAQAYWETEQPRRR